MEQTGRGRIWFREKKWGKNGREPVCDAPVPPVAVTGQDAGEEGIGIGMARFGRVCEIEGLAEGVARV